MCSDAVRYAAVISRPPTQQLSVCKPDPTPHGEETTMQHEQDQWYHEVDQEEYEPGGRYALSIQVRNLPSTWAKRGNRTKQALLAMLQSCTSARLTNPSTGHNYLSRPKKGKKQYAYAFVSVYTEEEGNTFIQEVRSLVVEGEILEAK